MSSVVKTTGFDKDGNPTGGSLTHLPPFLDWMPIRVKAFWYVTRGFGNPKAEHVLLDSQGEQLLIRVTTPLQFLKYDQLKEIDHGLEERIEQFIEQGGFSRTPRNQ